MQLKSSVSRKALIHHVTICISHTGQQGQERSSFPRPLHQSQAAFHQKRRAQPGHPWRLKPSKAANKKAGPCKFQYVWLINFVPVRTQNLC